MSSNLSLQRALYLPALADVKSLDANEIWRWLEKVISHIGGHTVDKIEANCAYSKYNMQTVSIDGKNYQLLDPTQRKNSCPEESMKHIDGGEKPTYLAGAHQLLSFGVFTKRSVPHGPIRGSVSSGNYVHEIPSDDIIDLNPVLDHKIAEVCSVAIKPPVGNFNHTICILSDGFNNTIGSSFDWPGM
jgi:hypothetical protein